MNLGQGWNTVLTLFGGMTVPLSGDNMPKLTLPSHSDILRPNVG